MTEQNDVQKQEAGACGPGCSCGTTGSGSRIRWVVGVAILLVAGVLVVRAMVKDNGAQANTATTGFAALPAPEQTPGPNAEAKPSDTEGMPNIGALSELNALAAKADGVFVFVAAKGEADGKIPTAQMQAAAKTIAAQGKKIGMFALNTDSPDYEAITAQMPVPGVLAMVKGRGAQPVSGEITQTKLIQAFVAASSAGACGPDAGAGCCPK